MAARLALVLLFAACISCAFAQKEDVRKEKEQCERAFGLMPWRDNYRLNCRYLCKGWPIRFGYEEDGKPCGPFNLLRRVCKGGKCVKETSRPSMDYPEESETSRPSMDYPEEFITAIDELVSEEDETTAARETTTETEVGSTSSSSQESSSMFE
ncbi:uncharacterized protein LOC144146779 [Haemaphysalis longicornis]